MKCTGDCNQGRDCPGIAKNGEAAFVLAAYGVVMLLVGLAAGCAVGWGW